MSRSGYAAWQSKNRFILFTKQGSIAAAVVRPFKIKKNMLKLVSEDFFHQIFEDVYYDGTPVRFIKSRFTGEIRISSNDVARVLGYGSINDLLGTDGGLDAVSDWKKDNPGKTVFGKYGSGAMLEEFPII